MGMFDGGGLGTFAAGALPFSGSALGLLGGLAADRDSTSFSPTKGRKFGDNASAYNSMYSDAAGASDRALTGADAWEQDRQSLGDYLQQQTYDQQMANLGFQQEDALRHNKFDQARNGMLGGSADMGAQAAIVQQGVVGQGMAGIAGQQAALNQQNADAATAMQMRQQAYGFYDPANAYGNFAAQNQNTMSGSLYDWRKQSTGALSSASNEANSIMGGYLGGAMGSAAGSVGQAAGSYLGNKYKPSQPNITEV